MGARRRLVAALAALMCLGAGVATGQTAEVQISVPNVAFAPGVPVPITMVVRWTGAPALAHLEGSIVVTPGSAGPASNFSSQIPPGALVNLGSFSGPSRVGIDISSVPPFFLGGTVSPPWGNNTGITIARYDLEVQTPSFYYVRWVPNPGFENVLVYPSLTSPMHAEAATSSISDLFFVGCCLPNFCAVDLTGSANPGSFNYGVPNGVLDNEDFFFFLARFAIGDLGTCDLTTGAAPGTPGYGVPNGILNNDDFFYYLAAFAQGC